jgi:hypothetical protein
MTVRSHSQYLTEAEIKTLREGFRTGRAIMDLTIDVNCSRRTVIKHFGKFRAAGLVRGSIAAPAKAPAPSRFYKSSFELEDGK